MASMPEWTIYKENQAIGQSKTWHGALDVLCRQEGLSTFTVEQYARVVFVRSLGPDKKYYQITKTH